MKEFLWKLFLLDWFFQKLRLPSSISDMLYSISSMSSTRGDPSSAAPSMTSTDDCEYGGFLPSC